MISESQRRRNRRYYLKNRENILANVKAKRDPEVLRTRMLSWKARNPNYFKEHLAKNRDTILDKKRQRYVDNIEAERTARREHGKLRKIRYAQDPAFAMLCRLRARLTDVMKTTGARKSARTLDLLGCTIVEFRQHLEALFKPGMTWENRSEWHIDHDTSCVKFDLRDPEEQRRCFHYTNLVPLWKIENLRKGWQLVTR